LRGISGVFIAFLLFFVTIIVSFETLYTSHCSTGASQKFLLHFVMVVLVCSAELVFSVFLS